VTIRVEPRGAVTVVTVDRPERRNAVDPATRAELIAAFEAFAADATQNVAVLTGAGGVFCAGADLRAMSGGDALPVGEDGPGPMGPTRMRLDKPVIAAIEGWCVAGGLELACWCDLRVAARDATFGVFNRRFGVPLIDMGTVRLPRLIGLSRALDLILTGRAVAAEEAFAIGLVNRLVEPGTALAAALELAEQIAGHPQAALRGDRHSAYDGFGLDLDAGMRNELRHGVRALASGEATEGARRFSSGERPPV
jgi:enoyl-CoA hydratase